MQQRIVAVIAVVAICGFRPMQANQDFTVALNHDEELDWTAGSTLGLQRSAKIEKKLPVHNDRKVSGGSSFLGLQRSTRVEKTDVKKFTVDLFPEHEELDWTSGTTLGLQRSATLIKKRLAQKKDIALGESLLGLQRNTRVQKTTENKFTVDLKPEDETAFTAGTTLGLQRSATLIRKAPKQKEIATGTSLLGLQRRTRMQKTTDNKFTVDLIPETERAWKSGTTLGLQRSATLIKRPPAQKSQSAFGPRFLGFQQSALLQKTVSPVEEDNEELVLGRVEVSAGANSSDTLSNATHAKTHNATSVVESSQRTRADAQSSVQGMAAAPKVSMLGMQRNTKLNKVVLGDDDF